MKTCAAPLSLRLFTLGTLLSVMCAVPSASDAAVSAGGLVVVGYTDNNYDNVFGVDPGPTSDVITLLATEMINAGEVIYLTNNGWLPSANDLGFSGAKADGDGVFRGAGSEQITKLTITSTIFAGTVISTNASGSNLPFQWTTSGRIVSNVDDYQNTFSAIDLQHGLNGPSTYSDQIYIFQADGLPGRPAGVNPLLNPTGFIHALNIGSDDSSAFSQGYLGGTTTGGLPDGRVSNFATGGQGGLHTGQGLDTADLDEDPTNDYSAFELDPSGVFMDGTSQFDLTNSDIIQFNETAHSKEEWLVKLSDSRYWIKAGSSGDPTFTTNFNILGVPEPSRALLVFIGSMSIMFRRRRCC